MLILLSRSHNKIANLSCYKRFLLFDSFSTSLCHSPGGLFRICVPDYNLTIIGATGQCAGSREAQGKDVI